MCGGGGVSACRALRAGATHRPCKWPRRKVAPCAMSTHRTRSAAALASASAPDRLSSAVSADVGPHARETSPTLQQHDRGTKCADHQEMPKRQQ